MKTFNYTKLVNLRLLQQELVAAGFQVLGLTYDHDSQLLRVSLTDAEMKDPSAIVQAHIYKEDAQIDLTVAMTAIRNKYQEAVDAITAAGTLTQLKQALVPLGTCLKWTGRVVGYLVGAVDLDNTEHETGQLDLDK